MQNLDGLPIPQENNMAMKLISSSKMLSMVIEAADVHTILLLTFPGGTCGVE